MYLILSKYIYYFGYKLLVNKHLLKKSVFISGLVLKKIKNAYHSVLHIIIFLDVSV